MAKEAQPVPGRTEPPRLPKTYTVGHERDASPQVGRVCFHCNLSCDVGTTDWLVDSIFIEWRPFPTRLAGRQG